MTPYSLVGAVDMMTGPNPNPNPKIAEVQTWVLCQCRVLGKAAQMLKLDENFHSLLKQVGDKLVDLHAYAAQQTPSDKHFLGQVRGYISVATFEATCDEHMVKISTLIQPITQIAMLERERKSSRGE